MGTTEFKVNDIVVHKQYGNIIKIEHIFFNAATPYVTSTSVLRKRFDFEKDYSDILWHIRNIRHARNGEMQLWEEQNSK